MLLRKEYRSLNTNSPPRIQSLIHAAMQVQRKMEARWGPTKYVNLGKNRIDPSDNYNPVKFDDLFVLGPNPDDFSADLSLITTYQGTPIVMEGYLAYVSNNKKFVGAIPEEAANPATVMRLTLTRSTFTSTLLKHQLNR